MAIDLKNLNELNVDDLKQIGQAPTPVKVVVLLIVFLAVAGGLIFWLVKPKLAELEASEKKELVLKQEFEQKQKKASNLQAYEDQLAEMEETFGSMVKSLPDNTEVESLLVEISRAASANNLDILEFKPKSEQAQDFYAEYPIGMKLKGTYIELTGFLSAVASLERIVTLHDMNLTPDGSKDEEGVISINLDARTYRYLSDGK